MSSLTLPAPNFTVFTAVHSLHCPPPPPTAGQRSPETVVCRSPQSATYRLRFIARRSLHDPHCRRLPPDARRSRRQHPPATACCSCCQTVKVSIPDF
nr:hypothetical protein Iba_chr01aCG3200 [Ipomoea batatas]